MTNLRKAASTVLGVTATLVVLSIGLSACNTIGGAGKDIKSTGKSIERAAEDSK